MTYYRPERSRSIVSEYEIIYTLACPNGHTWDTDPHEVNADWDGDGCECPTCGEWFSELVSKKEEPV